MKFDQPLLVSSSQYDKVRVTFVNTNLIFDAKGHEVEHGTLIDKFLPPQFASKEEADFFESVSSAV